MDTETGKLLPVNLTPNRFSHFTADNIDINDSTLDGKDTFHATQVAALQRGPEEMIVFATVNASSSERKLNVPEVMNTLIPVHVIEGKSEPRFKQQVEIITFQANQGMCREAIEAWSKDMAFHIKRQTQGVPETWSSFNQTLCDDNYEVTTVEYMPIIQAPAHEIDTLDTVVKRCMYISEQLGQTYTVITVDQALYFKLMDLKWCVDDYREKLIVKMGGLHIAMNFLKTIGDHMEGSGIDSIWVESGLLGQNATYEALSGKHYNRGIRANKITAQALWSLLLPQFMIFLHNVAVTLHDAIVSATNVEDLQELFNSLSDDRLRNVFDEFTKSKTSPNYKFWWQYLELVSIMLLFTISLRQGLWDLYVYSFRVMLPFFMRFDHTNYAMWGSVYLAETQQLPEEILDEFKNGNFVVKRAKSKFNQVDQDQSQEWLSSTGKSGGGIVGITKTSSALSRWALSYNLRSDIASRTYELFHANSDGMVAHKESSKGANAEKLVRDEIIRLKIFSEETEANEILQNAATKDQATEKVSKSLLNAKTLGQKQLESFVSERIIEKAVSFRATLSKNKAPTFASLYNITQISKTSDKIIKVDRNVMKRLITAYKAGRDVNLEEVLQHELMPVPVAIAELNGKQSQFRKCIIEGN